MSAILVRGMVRADKCGKECYDAHEEEESGQMCSYLQDRYG